MWKVKDKDTEREFEVYFIGRDEQPIFYLGDVESGVIHIVTGSQLKTDYLHIPSEPIMYVDCSENLDCRGSSFLPNEEFVKPQEIRERLVQDKKKADESSPLGKIFYYKGYGCFGQETIGGFIRFSLDEAVDKIGAGIIYGGIVD